MNQSTNDKLGIATGIKLGIGCFIGVAVAIVGCVVILFFFGTALFGSRQSQPVVTTATRPSSSHAKVPTVTELVEEANTPEQQAKLTEANRATRIKGHKGGAEGVRKIDPDIESALVGSDKTIWLIKCRKCNRDAMDGFLEPITPDFMQSLTGVGMTHLIITNDYLTAIRTLKSGQTQYYNEGFQVAP